jgi:hypothetical protein
MTTTLLTPSQHNTGKKREKKRRKKEKKERERFTEYTDLMIYTCCQASLFTLQI